MAHVFISYKREDQAIINRLVNELRQNGVQVWLDRNDITAGERWDNAIRNAICNGHYFMACFSKMRTGHEKSYANDELHIAIQELQNGKRDKDWFYPVTLDGTPIPELPINDTETLSAIQYLDFSTADWQSNVQRLLRKLYLPDYDDQLKIYAYIEKIVAIYSLVFWRSPLQKPPTILKDSEWENNSFQLSCDNIDWSNEKPFNPGALFECFSQKVTQRSSYESEPFEGYYVTPNEDFWYTFTWKSLFGYDLEVTINPSRNGEYGGLYDVQEALRKKTWIDGEEEGHPLPITGYVVEISGLHHADSVGFLVGSGYLVTSVDGYNHMRNEWVIYQSEDAFMREDDMLKLIRQALDWKQIFEPNLEKAIRILGSEWKGRYPYFNKEFLNIDSINL
jgi:hypothetical protein